MERSLECWNSVGKLTSPLKMKLSTLVEPELSLVKTLDKPFESLACPVGGMKQEVKNVSCPQRAVKYDSSKNE